jgi:hypothetical protein
MMLQKISELKSFYFLLQKKDGEYLNTKTEKIFRNLYIYGIRPQSLYILALKKICKRVILFSLLYITILFLNSNFKNKTFSSIILMKLSKLAFENKKYILDYLFLEYFMQIWKINYKNSTKYLKIVILDNIWGNFKKINFGLLILYFLINNIKLISSFFNIEGIPIPSNFIIDLSNKIIFTIFISINFIEAINTQKEILEFKESKNNVFSLYVEIIEKFFTLTFPENIYFIAKENYKNKDLVENWKTSLFILKDDENYKKITEELLLFSSYLEKVIPIDNKIFNKKNLTNYKKIIDSIKNNLVILSSYTHTNSHYKSMNEVITKMIYLINKIENLYSSINNKTIQNKYTENTILTPFISFERLLLESACEARIDDTELEDLEKKFDSIFLRD